VTRESDERMCAGREFQLLGEDTQKAQEAKNKIVKPYSRLKVLSASSHSIMQT